MSPQNDSILYPASEATSLTLDFIRDRQGGSIQGLSFGTASIDHHMVPMNPGDLVMLCGRPGNGKTLIVQHMISSALEGIIAKGDMDGAVIYISWETSVEQATAAWLAQLSGVSATKMLMGDLTVVEHEDVNAAAMQVGSYPLYIISHSTQRTSTGTRKRPNLTVPTVTNALDHLMNKMKLEPRLIVKDYLQRIPNQAGMERVESTSRTIDWSKDTALQAGCPVVLCTQARREVDDYKLPMPALSDSQFSSNAEQSADKFMATCMPKNYFPGKRIKVEGIRKELEVTENLLLLALLKQKFGPSPLMFPLYVEPDKLKLGDLDLYTQDPNSFRQPVEPVEDDDDEYEIDF